jgi:hypothetical protein
MFATRMLDVSVARAQSENACTQETIKGTYLYHGEGVAVHEGKVVPYAEAGVWTLDGKGNTEGVISISMDGKPFATRQAGSGATYEHVGNCVYAVKDEFGFEVDLYTTPTGSPMTYYAPGFSGVMLKQ